MPHSVQSLPLITLVTHTTLQQQIDSTAGSNSVAAAETESESESEIETDLINAGQGWTEA